MVINVKLFATLQEGRFSERALDISEGAIVNDLLMKIGITETEATIIFVNSRHADIDHKLKEGDTVALFPPIGGG